MLPKLNISKTNGCILLNSFFPLVILIAFFFHEEYSNKALGYLQNIELNIFLFLIIFLFSVLFFIFTKKVTSLGLRLSAIFHLIVFYLLVNFVNYENFNDFNQSFIISSILTIAQFFNLFYIIKSLNIKAPFEPRYQSKEI